MARLLVNFTADIEIDSDTMDIGELEARLAQNELNFLDYLEVNEVDVLPPPDNC